MVTINSLEFDTALVEGIYLPEINLNVSSLSGTITKLLVYLPKDFISRKNPIDLSSLLQNLGTEAITITAETLGVAYLEGVYYFEISDSDDCTEKGIVANLLKYRECILDKLCNTVDDCVLVESINIQTYLDALMVATELQYSEETAKIASVLNELTCDCANKNCENCQSIYFTSRSRIGTAANIYMVV